MIRKFFHKLWPFGKADEPSVRDTIEELIEETEEGEASLDPEEKTLLTNILNLRNLTAEDVMVPRADIAAVPVDISYDVLSLKLSEMHNTRILVYRGTLDEILGFIHIKDVLDYKSGNNAFDLNSIIQEALFIAPSMRLLDLLLQIKITRIPIALVVDEYGGVDGLVTTWDIIKVFLGDLSTPNAKDPQPEFTRLSDNSIMVDARFSLEDLSKEFPLSLTEEEQDEIDTVGGLVFYLAGRVPAKCEIVKHSSGLTFEVIEVDPRRIKKVRIYKSKNQEENGTLS